MNRLKNLLHRLLPLLKISAFSLLFVFMHILLIAPLLIGGVLTGEDFGREDDLFRLIMLGISIIAIVLSILIANRLAKHWKPSLTTQYISSRSAAGSVAVGIPQPMGTHWGTLYLELLAGAGLRFLRQWQRY